MVIGRAKKTAEIPEGADRLLPDEASKNNGWARPCLPVELLFAATFCGLWEGLEPEWKAGEDTTS